MIEFSPLTNFFADPEVCKTYVHKGNAIQRVKKEGIPALYICHMQVQQKLLLLLYFLHETYLNTE